MCHSPASPSPLPPEILALIFDKIEDESDLLRCSIVCRRWLPYARNNLRLWVFASDPTDRLASTWTEIIANPENTFTSTLHYLYLYEGTILGRVWTPLIPLLGAFTCLRSLELVDADITDLPAFPSLNYLALSRIRFQSYVIFVSVISKLSHIQSLKLDVVSWRTDGVNDHDRLEDLFPALQLVSLELSYFDERFMFALWTRRLVLAFTTWDFISASLPKYLVRLGPHLQTLVLIFRPTVEQAATLDFRNNINLAHLNIRFVIDFDECRNCINIHPSLVPLLSRIARHARLQSLTLHVQARRGPSDNFDWNPFSGLVQLLGTYAFSSVHTIEFLVHPPLNPSGLDLRSCFESALSAAISDTRVVYTMLDD